ncbi:MAG TPA: DUF2330 domain-containing protein [Polyangiaceae bacterium]|nr:DUF2330 domain-containing protein [Polyangiaceae bacterium]
MSPSTTALALCVAIALSFVSPAAHACAPAPRQGDFVSIADEEALIIWDEKQKLQHFIRRAEFRTPAKDFGFLVPTPTQPTLGEVSDDLFQRLERRVAPEVKYVKKRALQFGCMMLGAADKSAAVAGGVQVLDSQRVAGLDATVLAADSADALADWLKKHDYDHSPELSKWLEPYIAKQWKVTAFKLAQGETPKPRLASKAVRMTFTAERPFFPYREPESQRTGAAASGPRKLRTYLLASARMQGALAVAGGFPGKTKFARPIFDAARVVEDPALVGAVGDSPWLTMIEDTASPRPGVDDVFFGVATDRSEVVPAPVVVTERVPVVIPIELLPVGLVLLVIVGGVVLFVRRRKSAP